LATLKYDVSNAEPGSDLNHAKPGMYKAKVEGIEATKSKGGNDMLKIQLRPAKKKKKDKDYALVFYYILTDGSQDGRLREFLEAVGEVKKGSKKAKGQTKLEDLVGKTIQVQLKSDTDLDGDYRPRVGKVLAESEEAEEDDSAEEAEEEADDDDEESDEDEDDADDDAGDDDEEEEEDDDEDAVDLDELDRAELKKFIKDEDLEVKVTKKMSDEDIRNAIIEAMPEDDDDEEGDDDEDEEEDEKQDYSEWSVADLKAELKSRGLSTKGKKEALAERLEENDNEDEDPFEGEDDE
jgi:hypothetical protein